VVRLCRRWRSSSVSQLCTVKPLTGLWSEGDNSLQPANPMAFSNRYQEISVY
jgi:hypothetical protein